MGSSETGGVVDCSVGSIVWVRRRNGSWWPGKILGPEELSSSHVTSPRSGTPVKLLGREDASVDWYNLEKSKRVKSFRCGEFDDCIERAEAAQGMPPKKREKYARREDAILHALELERQLVEKKYGKSGNSSNGQTKSPDAITSSQFIENGSGNQNHSISDKPHEKVDSSLVEKNGIDQQPCKEMVKDGSQPSGDDDSGGALPRMRGLQDFGLRTTPLMREEQLGIASRAKRSRNSYITYDSGDCSNDNQTLTTQIEIPVSKFEESIYQADVVDDHNSESTEDTETDCSETDSVESDSDEEIAALSDCSASIELHPKYPRSIEPQEEHGSISSSDDFDEMAYNTTAMSKWQLKGKRNNRNLGKRHGGTFRNHPPRYGSVHTSNGDSEASLMRGYWEEYQMMLIDVDLKVQANNYRRDVPMISLMSKLNGHAIIGHPIQIEPLESDCFHTEPPLLTSVWRTGRRTANARIPRILSRSSPKKSSPLLSQKIRSLSSIANDVGNYQVIKSGNLAATVACIPVNLVFSRLNEELVGRHQ